MGAGVETGYRSGRFRCSSRGISFEYFLKERRKEREKMDGDVDMDVGNG